MSRTALDLRFRLLNVMARLVTVVHVVLGVLSVVAVAVMLFVTFNLSDVVDFIIRFVTSNLRDDDDLILRGFFSLGVLVYWFFAFGSIAEVREFISECVAWDAFATFASLIWFDLTLATVSIFAVSPGGRHDSATMWLLVVFGSIVVWALFVGAWRALLWILDGF